ncbi:MAG: hypothetical protein WAS05_06910 [Candidatus Nanopelagicales bacterium]
MRSHLSKKFSAILISLMLAATGSMLVGTNAAQAAQPRGEVNFNGPLRFPTPKSVGLGKGWKVSFAAKKNDRFTSKSCRVATKCVALGWELRLGKSKGEFLTSAYRTNKSSVKLFLNAMKGHAQQTGSKLKIRRKGSAVTYTMRNTTPQATSSAAVTIFKGSRIAQASTDIPRSAPKSIKKNSSIKKLTAISQYLANPKNGRVLKVELTPN